MGTEMAILTTHDGIQVVLAPDVFQPNECVNLEWSEPELRPDLAAVTFLLTAQVSDVRADLTWACIHRACSEISQALPSHRLWLCACAGGENNRITRSRGLWRALATQGFEPTARYTHETCVEVDDASLRFYGAAELATGQVEALRPIVAPASCMFLSWLPSAAVPDIEGLMRAGWNRGLSSTRELAQVAAVIATQGGIVLRLFGSFDDREAGVDCIMGSEHYALLASLQLP
jgi:hypothetical protein